MTTEPNFDEIPAYIPKKGEEFMSTGQLKHFIHKLNVWREQLVLKQKQRSITSKKTRHLLQISMTEKSLCLLVNLSTSFTSLMSGESSWF